MPLVLAELDGFVGTLTLNHEAKRNCLSESLVDELVAGLQRFAQARVRCIVLRARPGVTVWSAGHDVSELPEGRRDPLGWQDPLRKLVRGIEACPAPVIAMIDGSVWGGACETVFACDLIIATPTATFAATPARHGVPYNVGGLLTFFNAAHERIAKEMLFTAQPIPANRLERMGIINHVVPADDVDEFTYATARTIAQNAPLSIAVMKEQLRSLAGAHSMSPHDFERIQGLRREVYDSADYAEGIRAFKEKRRASFTGE